MIELKELCVLLQTQNIKLRTKDILILRESLNSGNFCYFNPGRIKHHAYKKLYNKSWFFSELNKVRQSIKKWTEKDKLQIITIDEDKYPSQFLKLKNPPACIYMKGTLPDLTHSVAIVGRREAKSYTLNWMQEHLTEALKSHPRPVVSGGARGVDTKAHQLALMNSCPTVYVIPSGLLNLYPEHLNLNMNQLIKSGATFISTYHPEERMQKQNFADRNWLIAALAHKVIILEAEFRSGTYKTAMYSLELGQNIGVVPSFPTDLSYSGSLQLIYDGASVLRDSNDIISFF